MDPVTAENTISAAKAGDATAQFELGLMHEHGINAAKDLKAAARWYSAAADRGNAQAAYKLAQLYQIGLDGQPDLAKRNSWLKRAAEGGLPEAQYKLASMLEKGVELDGDASESARWYIEAAKQGIIPAQVKAGLCYQHGAGVKKDLKAAVQFFREAAEKGNPDAQYHLAVLHTTGSGVEQNTAEAFRLFQLAAEAGQVQAKQKFSGIKNRPLVDPVPEQKKDKEPIIAVAKDETLPEMCVSSIKPAIAASTVIVVLLFTPLGDLVYSILRKVGWVIGLIVVAVVFIGAFAAFKFFNHGRKMQVNWNMIAGISVAILVATMGFAFLSFSGFKVDDPTKKNASTEQSPHRIQTQRLHENGDEE